jgi:hypothetical protein
MNISPPTFRILGKNRIGTHIYQTMHTPSFIGFTLMHVFWDPKNSLESVQNPATNPTPKIKKEKSIRYTQYSLKFMTNNKIFKYEYESCWMVCWTEFGSKILISNDHKCFCQTKILFLRWNICNYSWSDWNYLIWFEWLQEFGVKVTNELYFDTLKGIRFRFH